MQTQIKLPEQGLNYLPFRLLLLDSQLHLKFHFSAFFEIILDMSQLLLLLRWTSVQCSFSADRNLKYYSLTEYVIYITINIEMPTKYFPRTTSFETSTLINTRACVCVCVCVFVCVEGRRRRYQFP